MQEAVRCDFCHSDEAETVYGDFNVVRCRQCKLTYMSPRMTVEELSHLYDERYFRSEKSTDFGYDDYIRDREPIVETFRKRLADIEARYDQKGDLLDIGCAAGFFMEVARERGWRTKGVEVSEFAARYAREELELDVFTGTIQKCPLAPASFDVVSMWDYIEHSHRPAEELGVAYDVLKDGGMLVITTPNISSLPSRIFREKWMEIKPREHIYYFSKRTLTRYLQRTGFEIEKVSYIGKYMPIGSLIDRLGLYSKAVASVAGFVATRLSLHDKALYVNPMDIMLVYARKGCTR